VVLLGVSDFWERRDPESLLLLLWIIGILVFTAEVNWTANGRSLLPAVPPLGILIARRLARHCATPDEGRRWRWALPLFPVAAISLLLARTDSDMADMHQTAAKDLFTKYQHPGQTVWFDGGWGFKFYMEQMGARAIESHSSDVRRGDAIVVNYYRPDFHLPCVPQTRLLEVKEYTPNHLCATMSGANLAGFYASDFEPLPFSIGKMKPERLCVFEVTQTNTNPQRGTGQKPLASKEELVGVAK
jgi:hypothetical protein